MVPTPFPGWFLPGNLDGLFIQFVTFGTRVAASFCHLYVNPLVTREPFVFGQKSIRNRKQANPFIVFRYSSGAGYLNPGHCRGWIGLHDNQDALLGPSFVHGSPSGATDQTLSVLAVLVP